MKMSLTSIIFASVFSFASMNAQAKASTPKEPLKPVVHVCKKTDTAVNALACNIYFEARGEKLDGQMNVAFATVNRLKNKQFPNTMVKVVYQSKQFSWVDPTANFNVRDKQSWEVSKEIAKFLLKIKDNEVLYNKLDPTSGATYFHTKQVKPIWRHSFDKTVVVGNHVFYKIKEDTNS